MAVLDHVHAGFPAALGRFGLRVKQFHIREAANSALLTPSVRDDGCSTSGRRSQEGKEASNADGGDGAHIKQLD